MNKMIVVVFETEAESFKGLTRLKELHVAGDISMYASAVIEKDQNNEASVKQAADSKAAAGSTMGLLTGALIGVLAGPAGMLVGASVGGLTGALFDLDKAGISAGFVSEVSEALTAGKFAVIAEVDEAWTTPVDVAMAESNGIVFRRLRNEVANEQLHRELDAAKAELAELEDELSHATGKAADSIKSHKDLTVAKMKALTDQATTRLENLEKSSDEKLNTLEAQLKDASHRQKGKIEKRIAKLKAETQTQKLALESAAKTHVDAYKKEHS